MSEKKERKPRSDKGQKRLHYIQQIRKQRKMFADLKRAGVAIEKFEEREQALERSARMRQQRQKRYRENAKAAGIKRTMSAEEKLAQKQRRREERERLLEQLAGERVCKLCNQQRVASRAWVYIQKTNQMICRGCYQKRIDRMGKASFALFVDWLATHQLLISNDMTVEEQFAKDCSNGGILK